MANSFPSNDDRSRHHRRRTSEVMKRMAETRKCPECGRKAALKRTTDGDYWHVKCRWCPYEKGGYVDLPNSGRDL